MVNSKEIIQKVIEKAIDNGFYAKDRGFIFEEIENNCSFDLWDDRVITFYGDPGELNLHYFQVIFSHEFAKALWGEESIEVDPHRMESGWDGNEFWEKPAPNDLEIAWEYHLQQMVLFEDPLEYLAEFV